LNSSFEVAYAADSVPLLAGHINHSIKVTCHAPAMAKCCSEFRVMLQQPLVVSVVVMIAT
jgi:hypothetical protein